MRHCALQVFSYSISEEKTRKEREESQQTYVIRHVLCCTGSNSVEKIYDESSHAARGMFLVQFPQAYLCWTANRILRAVHARVGPRARTPSLLSRSSVTIDECARTDTRVVCIRATTAITTTTMTTTCMVSEFGDGVVPVTPSSVGSSEQISWFRHNLPGGSERF